MATPTSSPPGSERRRHPRFGVDLPVTLSIAADGDASYEARLKDLSAGGCLIESALPREDFQTVSLSFRRNLRAPIIAGKVVRRLSGRAFAVRFDDVDADLVRLSSALSAIAPSLRADFVRGFLDPIVELY